MHLYWCELCWACVTLFSVVWVGIAAVTVVILFAGAWTALAWAGGFLLLYSVCLFLIAYGEARSHWKRGNS